MNAPALAGPSRIRGRTLVVIGGGTEAVPGIFRAKELGLRVVVTDANANAPGASIADEFVRSSTYDVRSTVNCLRKLREPLHGVICIATDASLTVAAVAQEFGLPGISVDTARLASDKIAMKDRFARDGLPIPWFSAVSSAEELKRLRRGVDGPLIVKPADSRGSRGVLRLLPDVDSDWAYAEALQHSPSSRVIVEKFLDGPQISSESIVVDGAVTTVGLADRNYEHLSRFAPHVIEDGGELPADLGGATEDAIHEAIEGVARSLRIQSGVIKGDLVIHRGEVHIIEVAARLSGGYFCTHEIPLASGVDIVGAAILLALGEDPGDRSLKPRWRRHVAQRYLFPRPGRVVSIEGLEDVRSRPGIELCEVRVAVGDVVAAADCHPARAGVVITTGSTRSEARDRAVAAVRDIRVETVDL